MNVRMLLKHRKHIKIGKKSTSTDTMITNVRFQARGRNVAKFGTIS